MSILELKHIAAYLPYGLRYLDFDDNPQTIDGLPDLSHVEYYCDKTDYGRQDHLSDVKPLLRPMSDLFKEIEHNGETVKVIIELRNELDSSNWIEDNKEMYLFNVRNGKFFYPLTDAQSMPYFLVEILLKYHFDVFGLIAKGLANPII